jgi:proteasome beta subunit
VRGSLTESESTPPILKTGTTTIGMVCKDGVVMASERRATGGNFIASKTAIKVFRLDTNLAITMAGYVGDAQVVIRYLTAEIALYRLRKGGKISVQSAATLLSNLFNGNRYYPYLAWMIIGGVDGSGSHVFSVDAGGGTLEDKFVSVGSGSTLAYGVIEENYKADMSVSDGVDLAIRALTSAMKRDSASGDGYIVHTITGKDYKELSEDDIAKRLKSLRIPLPPALP